MNKRIFVATALTLVCGLSMISPMKSANATELTRAVRVINHDGAQTVLNAAAAAATRLEAPCAIAVVDRGGILVGFDRMDGVWGGSPDLAIGKARASALLERPTSETEDNINKGRTAFVTADFLSLRGGVPLVVGGHVVGAVGVAGLNKDNDVKIATAAAEAFAKSASSR
jgi:glc operon protein GlcG